MSEIRNHWEETKKLVKSVDSKKIAHWLLTSGYFPEQYIFPPSFTPQNFSLKDEPYYNVKVPRSDHAFKPKLTPTQILNIAYPKSELTDRIFGIYHPKTYHDLVWYIEKHWNQIYNHLFDTRQRIYSYSFPIPITSQQKGEIGPLRSGRMIYEYLELAEKDLLSESYKYKFLLKTDIKNFYPSIYTHSISWAIHTKKKIRDNNEQNLRLVGNILDRIAQYGNDRKTNGIPIGPAISDLITEIILSAVDKSISKIKILKNEDIVAARYKDDYFFLLENDYQADTLLKHMQSCFKDFNLFINEEKTEKYALPDGLFRPWILKFDKIWNALNLDPKEPILFRNFYLIAQEVFKIDKEYPGTGLINKFIAKLTDKNNNYSLNIDFSKLKNKKQGIFRTYSILIHFSKRSRKSFPNSLGVVESIIRAPDQLVSRSIKTSLILEMKNLNKELLTSDDEHQKLWWVYFVLSNNSVKQEIDVKPFYKSESEFLKSFNKGKQKFFTDFSDAEFFKKPEEDLDYPIAKHLNIFNKD